MNPKIDIHIDIPINFPIDIIKYHILPNCDRLCDLIRWRTVSKQFKKRIDEILYKEEPVLSLRYLKLDRSDCYDYHIIYNAKQFTRNNGLILYDPINSCDFRRFNHNIKPFLFYSELQPCTFIINGLMDIHLYEGVLIFYNGTDTSPSFTVKHRVNLKNNISQKYHFLKLMIEVIQLKKKYGTY